MNIFKELHKGGQTIIMVTHEKEVANRADKKIYIKDGRLVKKYL